MLFQVTDKMLQTLDDRRPHDSPGERRLVPNRHAHGMRPCQRVIKRPTAQSARDRVHKDNRNPCAARATPAVPGLRHGEAFRSSVPRAHPLKRFLSNFGIKSTSATARVQPRAIVTDRKPVSRALKQLSPTLWSRTLLTHSLANSSTMLLQVLWVLQPSSLRVTPGHQEGSSRRAHATPGPPRFASSSSTMSHTPLDSSQRR